MENQSQSWILKFFKEFLKLEDKYGFWRIIKSLILMMFFGYAIYLTFNPSVIFERYSQYEEQRHSESFNKRMEVSPLLNDKIKDLLDDTNAYRAFIIEMHNGKYNSNGLSFNYGMLTYEADRDSVENISEDYNDFTLERFPLILKVYKEGYWFGDIEQLKNIDKKLALRLESNGAYYLALHIIYGTNDAVGFAGITYSKYDKIDVSIVKKQLDIYTAKFAPMLANKKTSEYDE